MLTAAVELLKPKGIILATRRSEPDHSWQQWQQELQGVDMGNADLTISFDFMRAEVEALQLGSLIDPEKYLSISVNLPFIPYLKQAVLHGLPQEVCGNFAPTNCTLRIGFHDLWEHLENEKG